MTTRPVTVRPRRFKHPIEARNIVAMLRQRERMAKRLRDRAAKTTGNQLIVTFYEALWAEAHNAANASRYVLTGYTR